jgi:hypothetical protein
MFLSANIKEQFLDRKAVVDAIGKETAQALSRAGGYLRLVAQRSMRYVTLPRANEDALREGEVPPGSAPGSPPRAIRPHPWIRDRMAYAYDASIQGVVAGPEGFAGSTGAPPILEEGGRTLARNKRRRIRKLGGAGEVRLGGRMSATTKPARAADGSTVFVTYARLNTAALVVAANQFNEALYGPLYRGITVAPRPYMAPALQKTIDRLPDMFVGRLA